MAMEDVCKQAAGPTPPPQLTKKSSRIRVLLPYAACAVPAAAHLARAVRDREPRGLAFVAAAHGILALLFLCLGRFEAAPTAEARRRLRVWVWALSTALTGLFAGRVAPAMPPPLGLLVHGTALLVVAGGFVLLIAAPLRRGGRCCSC
ncbi:unnamed protein product [Urochloa humidicola]